MDKKFQLWGWLFFLVCAVFFILSSIQSGSTLTLIGSIIFLVGCVLFIVPLVTKRTQGGED